MAEKILIIGESGSGKSTSLREINSEETVIIRVVKKPLPFPGWKNKYKKFDKETKEGNLFDVSTPENVILCFDYINSEMKHIKNVVVDDTNYIMTYEFMREARTKGYEKYSILAENMFNVFKKPDELRDDLTIVFFAHCTTDDSVVKMKTIGKMLAEKITPEGMFTYVLMTDRLTKGKDEIEHVFLTKSNGNDVIKTPMGMFDNKYITNDLNYVIARIREYNER